MSARIILKGLEGLISRSGGTDTVLVSADGLSGSLVTGAASTFLALTDTPANYTSAANKILKVNSGATAVEFVTLSGDVSIGATGVAAIGSEVIVNADVAPTAAIAFSKLAALPSAQVLVGSAGNVATAVAISGDVALANDGSATVTDLTIASEAQGDILYRNATNWVRLAAGTAGQALITAGAASNPYWGAPALTLATAIANGFTIEGGTYDPATTITAQTSSAAALTIPDLAGVAQQWAFTKVAQTFLAKTLDDATVKFADTADATKDLFFSLGGATTDKTVTIVSSQTDDRSITLPDATTTLVGTDTTDTLSNKTLTLPKIATTGAIVDAGGDEYLKFVEATTPVTFIQITSGDTGVAPKLQGAGETNTDLHLLGSGTGNVKVSDGTDPTKLVVFEVAGATTAKTMTLTHSHTDDRTLTFPDATDTLVGKATTDTLTNKTIDANGTGNVITNINAAEVEAITLASEVLAVPFKIVKNISNSADTTIYNSNAPFKFRILNAYVICTGGTDGTWKITNGTNDISTAIALPADTTIGNATSLDDQYWEIAQNGSLHAILSVDTDDAFLVIDAIRID